MLHQKNRGEGEEGLNGAGGRRKRERGGGEQGEDEGVTDNSEDCEGGRGRRNGRCSDEEGGHEGLVDGEGEVRPMEDGEWYTYKEVIEWYGEVQGEYKWENSEPGSLTYMATIEMENHEDLDSGVRRMGTLRRSATLRRFILLWGVEEGMNEWRSAEIMTEEMLREEEARDREDEERDKAFREEWRLRDIEDEKRNREERRKEDIERERVRDIDKRRGNALAERAEMIEKGEGEWGKMREERRGRRLEEERKEEEERREEEVRERRQRELDRRKDRESMRAAEERRVIDRRAEVSRTRGVQCISESTDYEGWGRGPTRSTRASSQWEGEGESEVREREGERLRRGSGVHEERGDLQRNRGWDRGRPLWTGRWGLRGHVATRDGREQRTGWGQASISQEGVTHDQIRDTEQGTDAQDRGWGARARGIARGFADDENGIGRGWMRGMNTR